jgi:hypothetical protein
VRARDGSRRTRAAVEEGNLSELLID